MILTEKQIENMPHRKWQMAVRLLTCALMLLAVAVQRSGRIAGHNLAVAGAESDSVVLSGTREAFVIDTRAIAADIKGYGGDIPLKITVSNGKVSRIEPQRNAETPEFFSEVQDRLLRQYTGMTPEEVLQSQLDAVSGATLSSRAAMETMKRGMEYAVNRQVPAKNAIDWSVLGSARFVISFCVVLMGAVVPLFVRNRRYRTIQLALNVLVLGFWCGTFLSYSLIVNYLANGLNRLYSVIPLFLLVTAFVYPFFGRKSHYCTWLCPLGSLQELAGSCTKRKWKLSPEKLKYLDRFRDGLWALLMLLMWSGVCLEWMDYEPFSAFLFTKASWIVIVIALVSVALSFVVTRPYCRFVCPTGNLFRITQNPR